MQVSAAAWVSNQSIPFAVLSGAAAVQHADLSSLPVDVREGLNLLCQLLQLGCTYALIRGSTSQHGPLPAPW
jgi:hypothetical protein